ALQCWVVGPARSESVKRTTEIPDDPAAWRFSRPLHELAFSGLPDPTDESVGYFRSSDSPTSRAKLVRPLTRAFACR
ncbi:MAG TPA: hypothetical protein VMS31_22765, partial [Pyrinomonadaceae bacterium]|nr:hypothetical protein [Pyrinomonadaceae bacterium]